MENAIAIIFIVLFLLDIAMTVFDFRSRERYLEDEVGRFEREQCDRLRFYRTRFDDILLKIEELKVDFGKFYSLIENYSQLTCISGEEFDEKLEEVRKILEELEERGNNNGQEEKIA